MSFVARGCSAVGSASPCQGEGRGFESRHPLEGAMASTPAVEWPSGEATACKAVHTGSIPVSTSKKDPARLAQRESASLTRKRPLVNPSIAHQRYRSSQAVFSPAGGRRGGYVGDWVGGQTRKVGVRVPVTPYPCAASARILTLARRSSSIGRMNLRWACSNVSVLS
jgi:hypothetical protein